MKEILDFISKSPDDPEILEAQKNHRDFVSPLGEHKFRNNRYYIIVPDSIIEGYRNCLRQPFVSGQLPPDMISQSDFDKLGYE